MCAARSDILLQLATTMKETLEAFKRLQDFSVTLRVYSNIELRMNSPSDRPTDWPIFTYSFSLIDSLLETQTCSASAGRGWALL